jgi:DNA-directed RNA polymerase specialized sigma24 family protein
LALGPPAGDGFALLLERLDPDPKRAEARFHALRARLVRLFAWRECAFPDDLADLTLERVARKLAEGTQVRPPDPWAYVAGVAHNVFRETLRREGRERAALRIQGRDLVPASAPEDERLPCLERCLEALPASARELVLSYHDGVGALRIAARADLARGLGLTAGALRIKVHRLKESIEACVRTCLGSVTSGGAPPYARDSGQGGPE